MQRERDLPLHRHLVDGGAARGFQPIFGNAVKARFFDDPRVVRIEEDAKLSLVQVLLPGGARCLLDAVGVVEHDAEIADATHAGFRAHRRLARLDARVAEDALLGFAARPVVIDLLVWAAGHAHTPPAALVLVDQDDAVFVALVNRTRGAGSDAGRVETVLA